MVIICPECNKAITCDSEESCIAKTPEHNACKGGIGFVLEYDSVMDEPYNPPIPKRIFP